MPQNSAEDSKKIPRGDAEKDYSSETFGGDLLISGFSPTIFSDSCASALTPDSFFRLRLCRAKTSVAN